MGSFLLVVSVISIVIQFRLFGDYNSKLCIKKKKNSVMQAITFLKKINYYYYNN